MSSERVDSTTELSVSESWALVRSVLFGRLAVVVDGHPDIFPVNHVVDHGAIVLRTAPGAKLAAAARHEVAYEVDGYDAGADQAWSVVMKGLATPIIRLHEMIDVLELQLSPWHDGAKPSFLRIEPTTVTGRRFQVSRRKRYCDGL